jgi:hypothetical protein
MKVMRNDVFIRLLVIGHDIGYVVIFDCFPELATRIGVAGAHFAVEEPPPISINSIQIQQ